MKLEWSPTLSAFWVLTKEARGQSLLKPHLEFFFIFIHHFSIQIPWESTWVGSLSFLQTNHVYMETRPMSVGPTRHSLYGRSWSCKILNLYLPLAQSIMDKNTCSLFTKNKKQNRKSTCSNPLVLWQTGTWMINLYEVLLCTEMVQHVIIDQITRSICSPCYTNVTTSRSHFKINNWPELYQLAKIHLSKVFSTKCTE